MRNFKYQVRETVFDPKSLIDEENFYNQGQGKVSELTKKLTYVLGDYTKNYPISMMTMGNIASPSSSVELDDVQFTYPVMGRDVKASYCSSTSYVAGDKPGVGNSTFKLRFSDNWIKRYYIIESSRGVQAYVLENPVPIGNEWEYTVQLDPAEATDYCPLTEVAAGTAWVELNVQVAESQSRGSESKMVAPGQWKNQMGFIRSSIHWAGNAANKIMNIEMERADGSGTSNVWMDLAMWQFEKRAIEDKETAGWYSRYNRLADQTVPLKDLVTSKIIPRGSGILEQIQNKSSFSELSFTGLQNRIGDALFGHSDTDGMSITLFGGKGFGRDLDGALKAQGATVLTDFSGVADKFVIGSNSRELALSGYFTTLYHIDGYLIKYKYAHIFDHGRVAMKSPKHPKTGFPLESHRGVFIDDNDYDGQPNLQYVSQKGRSYLHGVLPGLTPMPHSLQKASGLNVGNDTMKLLANEKDESSYHKFDSCGWQLLRAGRCFDMRCTMGL